MTLRKYRQMPRQHSKRGGQALGNCTHLQRLIAYVNKGLSDCSYRQSLSHQHPRSNRTAAATQSSGRIRFARCRIPVVSQLPQIQLNMSPSCLQHSNRCTVSGQTHRVRSRLGGSLVAAAHTHSLQAVALAVAWLKKEYQQIPVQLSALTSGCCRDRRQPLQTFSQARFSIKLRKRITCRNAWRCKFSTPFILTFWQYQASSEKGQTEGAGSTGRSADAAALRTDRRTENRSVAPTWKASIAKVTATRYTRGRKARCTSHDASKPGRNERAATDDHTSQAALLSRCN